MNLARETIIALGTHLPPSVGVLGRLQAMLQRPDAEIDEIVGVVRVDAALAFSVIRLANSAFYGLRSKCESLEEAVARIGLADLQQIVGLAVTRQSTQGELLGYGIAAGRLWENTVAVAALVAELATLAGAQPRNAYLTGLLRSVGRVVLNKQLGARRYPGEESAPDVHAWDFETHGASAPEVAAVLLQHWRFAPETIETVRWQLTPSAAGPFAAGAARLHVASALAEQWGCGLPGEKICWKHDDATLALAGVPTEALAGAQERARVQFARCAMIEWSSAA